MANGRSTHLTNPNEPRIQVTKIRARTSLACAGSDAAAAQYYDAAAAQYGINIDKAQR
jgi:hypothetical protein